MRAMDTPDVGPRARLLRVPLVALGCGLAVALAACGGSEEGSAEDPAASTSADASTDAGSSGGKPACSDVWIDGQELPQRYSGCTDDGEMVKADRTNCSSGQVLVVYADRFYAVLGGPVNETDGLAQDQDYRQAELSCLA